MRFQKITRRIQDGDEVADREIVFMVRAGFWILAVVAAFGVGHLVGNLHYNDSPFRIAKSNVVSPATDESANRRVLPDRMAANEGDLLRSAMSSHPTDGAVAPVAADRVVSSSSADLSSRKLRLRSVSELNSASAQTGERVTFITEEAIQDASGRTVPAGAVVEGVISHARSSSENGAGKLVIEIHSMQAGRCSFSLSALPLAAIAISAPTSQSAEKSIKGRAASQPAVSRAAKVNSQGLLRRTIENLNEVPSWAKSRISGAASHADSSILIPEAKSRKAGTGTCEAVVPKETVLEFELITLPSGASESAPSVEPKSTPIPQPQRLPQWQRQTTQASRG